jgi:hypothetical protein
MMKNTTKWLEIIEIRTGSNNSEKLERALESLIESFSDGQNQGKIRIYRCYAVHSDFSIHLLHKSKKPDTSGSELGHHLAASLKEFGLLNHQVWHEMKYNLKTI